MTKVTIDGDKPDKDGIDDAAAIVIAIVHASRMFMYQRCQQVTLFAEL